MSWEHPERQHPEKAGPTEFQGDINRSREIPWGTMRNGFDFPSLVRMGRINQHQTGYIGAISLCIPYLGVSIKCW
ncbi:MAG TPA: hypothetical protein VNW15_09765 [Rhizomicrobium sp.]|nr:hypothetical protein [Rhizomicrobium sp.]